MHAMFHERLVGRRGALSILSRVRHGVVLYRAAADFEVDQVCLALALGGLFVAHLTAGKIIRQADVVRQPAVYKKIRFAPKLLAPGPILGLLLEDFLQAGS